MANEQKAVAITDTPEFRAQLSAAVSAEVAKILSTLKQDSGTALNSGDRQFAETLALAMAQLNEQGNGRKYVDPKILRMRGEARERMKDLIVAARKDGKPASYKIVAKTLLDNQVVEPMWVDNHHTAQATEIDWPGVPNDAMVPLNDTAKEIHAAFLESVGSKPQSVLGAVPDAMDDAFGVTAGGLVVRGGAIPRHNQQRPEASGGLLNEQGLSVHHKNAPGRVVEKRVLGTIAAPAQQTI